MKFAFCAALLALTLPVVSFGMGKSQPVPQDNVCVDQGVQWVKSRFGAQAEVLGVFVQEDSRRANTGLKIWYTTNLCHGKFVGEYPLATQLQCTSAHYGDTPNYLHAVWATEECKSLLPGTVYP